jgi:hypothetical protein
LPSCSSKLGNVIKHPGKQHTFVNFRHSFSFARFHLMTPKRALTIFDHILYPNSVSGAHNSRKLFPSLLESFRAFSQILSHLFKTTRQIYPSTRTFSYLFPAFLTAGIRSFATHSFHNNNNNNNNNNSSIPLQHILY